MKMLVSKLLKYYSNHRTETFPFCSNFTYIAVVIADTNYFIQKYLGHEAVIIGI